MYPQSLNKYYYCFNNPQTFNYTTGNWPNWGKVWNGVKKAGQAVANVVKENIDVIQTGLDVVGMDTATPQVIADFIRGEQE